MAANAAGAANPAKPPWKPSWPAACSSRNPATNLPRNTRLSTRTGRKNPVRRRDPPRMVRRQSAGWNHAMHMRMVQEFLIPGVQHAEEADLRAEVSLVASHREQRLGAGAKQQTVDLALVLQRQRRQLAGQREHHMRVADWQQFPAARFQPAVARVGLALRTMPVPARVEGDGLMPAAGALVDVTAERRGAAADDGGQDLQVQPGEPFPAALIERGSGCADQVGHLQRWPRHLFRAERQRVQGAGRSRHVTLRKMDVDHRFAQVGVTEQ